ncbi:hypothetical protein Q8A73_024591, partial [Channa argus]
RWRLQWNSFLRHMGIGGSVVEFSPLHLQILTPLEWHETQQSEKGRGAVEHNVGIGSSVVMRLVCGLVRSTDGPSKNILSTRDGVFNGTPFSGTWALYVVLMDHQEKDSVYTRWRLQWNSFFQHVGIGGSVYVVLMDHQEKDSVYTRWRLQWNSFFQHVGIGGSVTFLPSLHLLSRRDGWTASETVLPFNKTFCPKYKLEHNVGIGSSVVMRLVCGLVRSTDGPSKNILSTRDGVFNGTPFSGTWALYVVLMDHQEKDSVYTRWRLQWNSFFQHVGI